jgi:WD40 repeat protein
MRARRLRRLLLIVLLSSTVCAGVAMAGYVPVPIMEAGKPYLVDLAYSPDGSTLATLTSEWVELLDADTFEPVARFGRGGSRIEYSPDGSQIAVVRRPAPSSIHDARTGALLEELPPARRVASAFSPDWRRFAYAEGDVVTVWDRDTRSVVATLTGDPEPYRRGVAGVSTSNPRITHLAFHPDGVRLLVASHRATVSMWNVESGDLLRHYRVGTWVQGIAASPDGGGFALHTQPGRRYLWALEAEQPRRVVSRPPLGRGHDMGYDRAGLYLWSAGNDRTLQRLDPRDDTVLRGRAGAEQHPHAPAVGRFSVHPGRGQVAGVVEDRIGIWATETLLLERFVDHAWGAGATVTGAVYLPRRNEVVTFGRVVRVWTPGVQGPLSTHEFPQYVRDVDVTPDGKVTVALLDGEARVFATRTGRPSLSAPIESTISPQFAISDSGRFLATHEWTRGTAIWSVATGRNVATLPTVGDDIRGMAFTPSEKRLVVRTTHRDQALHVWDIANEERLLTVQGGGPFASTERGLVRVVWARISATDAQLEVRRVGSTAPVSVIAPLRRPFRGDIDDYVDIDSSGRYVTLRDEVPETGEAILKVYAAETGELLATRPADERLEFTAGGDYLFAKGPHGGRALYRTEEFLNIPSHDVTPRNKLLTGWGDVKRTQLLPNYPNPFNPETWIPFDLAESGRVQVSVYDDLGSVVRRLDLGQLPAGAYRSRERAAYWDGRNDAGESVASGAYFIELNVGSRRQTRRAMLAK